MSADNMMIVLCGGMGKRMGQDLPKMLLPLSGRPLIYWTLKNLQNSSCIDGIVLAVPAAFSARFKKIVDKERFTKVVAVVDGGQERADSTRLAFAVVPQQFKWIGIHDGARPFVSHDSLAQCFAAARQTGCAMLAAPCKDTIKIADAKSFVQQSPERARCYGAQTPQIFRRAIAEKMHGVAASKHAQQTRLATDDAAIAQILGFKVKIVPGSYDNIKVTTPHDLFLARQLVKNFKK